MKMHVCFRTRRWVLLTLLACLPLSVFSAEEEIYDVRFTCLPWKGMERPKGIYFDNGEAIQELKFQSVRRSPVYEYRGTNPLVFFRIEKGLEGEDIRIPVATANIASVGSQTMLLFIAPPDSDSAHASRYKVVPMDDNPEHFGGGFYRIINLSQDTLYCKINQEGKVIASGNTLLVDVKSQGTPTVDVAIAERDDDEYKQIYRAQWPVNARQRTLIFLFPINHDGRTTIDTFMVSDYVLN